MFKFWIVCNLGMFDIGLASQKGSKLPLGLAQGSPALLIEVQERLIQLITE